MLTTFGARKHQGMATTKFKQGDIDLIFEVTEVSYADGV